MNLEYIWYLGLMAATLLIVGGGLVVPLLRVVCDKLKLQFLEGVKFIPAARMFWVGGAALLTLFVLSYLKTGSIVGMLPAPPPVAPVQRTLSDPRADRLKAQLLSDLPRDKSVTVLALLNQEEGCRFAREIHSFLKTNGFKMKEEDAACGGIVVPIVYGLKFTVEGDELKLIVGFPPR